MEQNLSSAKMSLVTSLLKYLILLPHTPTDLPAVHDAPTVRLIFPQLTDP